MNKKTSILLLTLMIAAIIVPLLYYTIYGAVSFSLDQWLGFALLAVGAAHGGATLAGWARRREAGLAMWGDLIIAAAVAGLGYLMLDSSPSAKVEWLKSALMISSLLGMIIRMRADSTEQQRE